MFIFTNIFIAIILTTLIAGYDVAHTQVKAVSNDLVASTPIPQVVIEDSPEKYIKEVFGVWAPRAFLLLKGNKRCGGENKQLDPKAVNVNRDGSRDRGIFQINDKFHPLTDEEAFDYKKNTDYAWRMFKNDNYTFIRWAAGRCMGI